MKESAPTSPEKGVPGRENDTSELEMLTEQKDDQWLYRRGLGMYRPGPGHTPPCGSWEHGFGSQCDLEALKGFATVASWSHLGFLIFPLTLQL